MICSAPGTGLGDIPMTVRAMRAGAVDFLAKPFRDQDMLDAVSTAIGRSRQAASEQAAMAGLRGRYQSLTPREREVMGLSEITVKIHRGTMMRKMGVRRLADLVRQAAALNLPAAQDDAP